MPGLGEYRRHWPNLDNPSEIHHGDALADVLDEPQIVRDEQVGQSELLLEIHQQVHDLSLHGHVERRDRLVEHQERWIEGQRSRQPDALPLAPAELARIAVQVRRVQPDEAEQFGNSRSSGARSPIRWMTSGSSTIWRARIRGLSDEYGS